MSEEIRNLGEFQLSVLREVGNIGAGHAATALSQLLGSEIQMNVPRVSVVGFEEISEIVGGSEKFVIGIFLRVEGEIPGSIFFLLQVESAKRLVADLIGTMGAAEPDEFSEMEISALQEIGNILAGSYLSSLADFTKKEMSPTPPAIAVDMAGAILSIGLVQLGADYALLVDTEFVQGERNIEGHFFMLPDPGSVSILFKSLGVDVQ
ncbi:chemotaxis protein CheC [Tumebacillus permanentifrigoris]|jgi:chemotaxis protein CheC|uniref:Chemotaxis protein CheC n=1 Tax=Tumebacillus permanentifrigoris TaxID=378543 RepID=A0A316D7I5_9BACL|nr:chemotaxis protein CheC [Tumebacillus permanentifrigoris]PWK12689.1 chemotaxis protein CheC [Tumebacillus permanentifrigoris]